MNVVRWVLSCGVLLWAVNGIAAPLEVEAFSEFDGEPETIKRKSNVARDPFAASEFMLQEAGRFTPGSGGGGGGLGNSFLPSLLQKAPKMKRLGFITGSKKEAVALLEVEGAGIYQVRNGDEISLHSLGREEVVKIRKVDAKMIEVQIGTIKQSIIVR